MRRIRDLIAHERDQPGLQYLDVVTKAMSVLPAPILTRLFGTTMKSVDFVASCVPGVNFPLYIGGAAVTSMFAFGPPAGTSANITLFSYCDQADVTITADPASVPDSEVLADCMRVRVRPGARLRMIRREVRARCIKGIGGVANR